MKITLKIECNTLLDAAVIEEFVTNSEKLSRSVTLEVNQLCSTARPVISRTRLDMKTAKQIVADIKAGEKSNKVLVERYGISDATVWRFRGNKHCLQKNHPTLRVGK